MGDMIEDMSCTQVPLSKKRALDLIDTVIVPISSKIRQDEALRAYFPDRESYLQHSLKMGHVAMAMLFTPHKVAQLLARMHEAHARHGIPAGIMDAFMTEFIQRYVAWARTSKLLPESERSRLEDEANACLQQCREAYAEQLKAAEEASFVMVDDEQTDEGAAEEDHFTFFDEPVAGEDDGFAFFEGESADAAIDDMHTSGEGKTQVSARDYMATGELLQEQVDVIMDEFRELEDLFARYLRFEPDFVQEVQQHLKYLADTLFGTFEFEQMGYSLQQLIRLLDRAGELDETQQALIFALLEQLVLDLSTWARKLFVEQDAIDIHYLDAALLASIAQIEMMFGE